MDYHVPILLALVAGALAGPVLRSSEDNKFCSQTCTESSKFSYGPGTAYRYKYEIETKTSMAGASEDHSAINIAAIVEIQAVSKCEMVLQISDVNIIASDSKQFNDQDGDKKFAKGLEKYDMRFSFQDGAVESVCPHENEATWAVNLKKGILSAFQNSMDSFEVDFKGIEKDVTGHCDTQYTVIQRGWRTLTIKKSKDVASCTNRQGYDTAIQTTPLKLSSGLKSLPILKSTHTCDQEVATTGQLSSSLCHEMHVFQPFSNGNNGAVTETTQKLSFIQDQPYDALSAGQVKVGDREELYFDHKEDENDQLEKAREGLEILKDICRSTITSLQPETPRQFSSLVYTMKKMDTRNLQRVFNQAHREETCPQNSERVRKIARDAFPMVGTEASIELMKTFISNNDVVGKEADMWLASLAFVHTPTKGMIKNILELLGLQSLSPKVLLPLSSLVHSYCRTNPQCGEVAEVREFVKILETNLGGGCKVDQNNFRNIMMTLRAIGNTGHADEAVQSLYNCMFNTENSMDIRVASIQAFRRLSCGADRNNLMLLFRDSDQDSELRIAAYLSLMQCPSVEFISEIRQTLAEENVNQVGSFVWSHLTNLMESSDPENRFVQNLLNDDALKKEFDLSKLKFSRNYEASAFLESINAGGKIDSNLVWSTKSFIPRSASLNLTFNLFGEAMNLFEIGGRVEGLETLAESYFGPMGYYTDNYNGGNDIPDYKPGTAGISQRKLKGIHQKANKKMDDIKGALYMRMFGNELAYNMFGNNNGVDNDNPGPEMLNFLKKMTQSEPYKMTNTKSFMFLDSKYTVPLVSGLPLNLDINGVATVALNTESKMDLKNPSSSLVLEGLIEPSGAVEIDSMMSVDAFVTRGGLKMVSTLHTSTGAKGKLGLTGGQALEITFDITKEKSEIIDLKTDFFIVYNNKEKEQSMITKNRHDNTYCTGRRLQTISGLVFCASVAGPNTTGVETAPRFPFTGPVHVNVGIEKRDIPSGYLLEMKVIKTPIQTLFRFLSNTPGSTENRAVGLDVDVNHRKMTLQMNLNSPWKTASFNGQLTDTSVLKGLTGSLVTDNNHQLFNLEALIAINESKDTTTYTPTIKLELTHWKDLLLNGSMKYVKKQSLDIDLSLTGVTETATSLQTSLVNTDTEVGARATFIFEKDTGYSLKAIVQKQIQKIRKTFTPKLSIRTPKDELVLVDGTIVHVDGTSLKVDMKMEKLTKSPITLKVDLSKRQISKKKRVLYNSRIVIQGPKCSSNFMMNIDNRNGKNIFHKMRWNYIFAKKYKDTITLNTRVKRNSNKFKDVVRISSKLNAMRNNNLDADFSMDFMRTKSSTSINSNLKYGTNMRDKNTKERVAITMLAKHRLVNKKKTVDFDVGLVFPAKNIDWEVKGTHGHDGQLVTEEITVKYHPERSVTFGLRLHNKSSDYPNYAGELTIGLPEERQMSFGLGFGKENDNKYISNLEFEIIKGRRTRIDTMLKIATEKVYEVEVGVQLPDLDPVRLIGAYTKQDHGFTTLASFKRGNNLYSISTEGLLEIGKAGKFGLDLIIPQRHVKILVDGSQVKSERHGLIDIQWNADKNIDDRFLINCTSDFKEWNDFDIGFTLHYPSRTISFDMKHSAAARYITSAEFSWSPKEKIEMKMIFRDDTIDISKRTELSVEFSSPFEGMEKIGLAVSLIRDSDQYQTKSSVLWGKKKKILVSFTTKVPVTAQSIDLVGTISTPFDNYESMTASLKHRLDSELKTSALIQWGRERISLTVGGMLEVNKKTNKLSSAIDLRTPFEGLRIFILNINHFDNSVKYESSLTLETSHSSSQVHLDKYLVDVKMDAQSYYDNKGTVQVTYPNDDISSEWVFEIKQNSAHVLLDIKPMRGNRFMVNVIESHQIKPSRKLTSKFELIMPSEILQELVIDLSHEDDSNFLKTRGSISKDNLEIFSSNVDYRQAPGSVELESTIRSVNIDDITFKFTSSHSLTPYRSHLYLEWAPYQVISVDSDVFFDDFGMIDCKLKLRIPHQYYNDITIKNTHKRNGLNWDLMLDIDLGLEQSIKMESTYRFDHVKLTSVKLSTPFPQFSGFETGFKINGNFMKFDGEASVAVRPYLGKTSANFNWSYFQGLSLSGAFNLITPFKQYPYMKANIDSNILGASRVSNLVIEYLPTQVVKAELDYRFTSLDTMEGTLKVTSPFTQNKEVTAGFTHVGDTTQFKTNAKITCECLSRPIFADSTFSSVNNIVSTFNMESPLRGYETVRWNFKHQGVITDFHTIAEYGTNDDNLSFESKFGMKEVIFGQLTLLTPFPDISKIHLQFDHNGEFPNTHTNALGAFNKKEVSAEFDLIHDSETTRTTLVMKTPFKKYETIKSSVVKKGALNNLVIEADYQYHQTWRVALNHKLTDENMQSSLVFNSPFLKDNVSMEIDHRGTPQNFKTQFLFAMGQKYKTTSRTEFIFELPTIKAESEMVTTYGEDTRVNSLLFEHSQKVENDYKNIDMSSKLSVNARKQKIYLDIGFKTDDVTSSTGSEMDMKLYMNAELPHPDFDSNKINFEFNSKRGEFEGLTKTLFTFETPLLEDILYKTESQMNYRAIDYKTKADFQYGDDKISVDEIFNKNFFSYRISTPFEGYETNSLLVRYDFDIESKRYLSYNATFESSALATPVVLEFEQSITFREQNIDTEKFERIIKVTYDNQVQYTEKMMYTPSTLSYKVASAFEFVDKFELAANYGGDVSSIDATFASRLLEKPIMAHGKFSVGNLMSKFAEMKFSSSFENFTDIYFSVRRDVTESSFTFYSKFTYEDFKKSIKESELDLKTLYDIKDEGNANVGGKLTLKSQFEAIRNMDISFDHKHNSAPIRANNVISIEVNNKRYLDYEAQFGSQDKFTGSITFKAPQAMEYSFSGKNEGESVEGDLILNWNKAENKNLFRLHFGLADSGDLKTEKKKFHVKVTNPSRIVGVENSFEKNSAFISSKGEITWDEENDKKASYELLLTGNNEQMEQQGHLKVKVPTRTIEMTTGYSVSEQQMTTNGEILWDAENDRDKKVSIKGNVDPFSDKKLAKLDVSLPSIDKEMSLKMSVLLNQGRNLINGESVFTYSRDSNKAVIMKYNLAEDPAASKYKSSWSIQHDETLTYIGITSYLVTKDTLTGGDLQLKYTDGSVMKNIVTLQGEIDRLKRELNFEVKSPVATARMLGHLSEENPHVLTVQTFYNEKPKSKTVWKIDTNAETLDASLLYDELTKQISTSVMMPNSTYLLSQTTRQSGSNIVQEGKMAFDLQDRVLHGHLKWRPQLFKDITSFSAETLNELTSEISSVLDDVTKSIGNEILSKYRHVSSSVLEELKPITESVDDEMKILQQDLREMRRELRKMYRQNDLYLQSLDEMYSGSVQAFLAGYSETVSKLSSLYVKAQETLEVITNKINEYPFQEKYTAMVNKMSQGIETNKVLIRQEIDKVFEQLAKKLTELVTLYDVTMNELSEEASKYAVALIEELTITPYVDNLRDLYAEMARGLKDMPGLNAEHAEKILENIHELLIDLMRDSSLMEKYELIYQRTQNILQIQFADIMDNEDIKEIYSALSDLYQQVALVYKYTRTNISFRDLLETTVSKVREQIINEFNQLPLGLLDLHKSRFSTFDLENGEVEFDLYLPIPMKNFDEMMRFTVKKYVSKLKAMQKKYFPRGDFCLSDVYHTVLPVNMNVNKNMLPPFDVIGTVSGLQHFTSFDGSHFDLAGLCSYVLATDLIDGNFTVMQKYTGGPRKLARDSLVVMVFGKTIEMSPNYMVTIDDEPTELPYLSEMVSIVRIGDKIRLNSMVGLHIISDFKNDYHIIELSGWYFGKVGGLLGSYDNEQGNDQAGPDGAIVERDQAFLNLWEVANSCGSKRNLASQDIPQQTKTCAAMFEKTTSSLRPCFLMVPPEEFQRKCDLNLDSSCKIAEMYKQVCAKSGIDISLPKDCVKCSAGEETEFSSIETVKYEKSSRGYQPQNSQDVVFVVEERQCNREMSGELKDIIHRVEELATKSGLSQNRYSLVGYAGSAVNSHTMEGQLFNDATKFAMGLENLRFKNLGPYTNPYSAVHYAMNLPFRTGVIKTIILVSCSPCEEVKGYGYRTLTAELKQRDITLHVLRQSGFLLKNNKSPKSQIFGIDNKELYLASYGHDQTDLFSEIDIPTDYCSSIALQTMGSVFDGSHVSRGSMTKQRDFLQKLAERVQSPPSECQVCSCELNDAGTPISVCRRCDVQPLSVQLIPSVLNKMVEYKNNVSEKLQGYLF